MGVEKSREELAQTVGMSSSAVMGKVLGKEKSFT